MRMMPICFLRRKLFYWFKSSKCLITSIRGGGS